MKIIHTDNYGGDYPDEEFVTGLPNLPLAAMMRIANAIQKEIGNEALRYYMVVEDDYILKPGFEP